MPDQLSLTTAMSPEQWIVSGDTGISSKTIWSVMMGVEMARPYPPLDPGDFGRCWRLLILVPAWRTRLHEVSARYPVWGPMVRDWRELERLYCAAIGAGQDTAPELYDRMQALLAEGRKAATQVLT